DLAQFPPGHANVIVDRIDVMRACLANHDLGCAEAALAPLAGAVDESELPESDVATLELARGDLARQTPRKRDDARAHYARCLEILHAHPKSGAEGLKVQGECEAALAKLN